MTGTASGTTPSPRPAHPVERVVHFQRLTASPARCAGFLRWAVTGSSATTRRPRTRAKRGGNPGWRPRAKVSASAPACGSSRAVPSHRTATSCADGVRGGGSPDAQALQAQCWPAGEHVRVRMGVHTGEASGRPPAWWAPTFIAPPGWRRPGTGGRSWCRRRRRRWWMRISRRARMSACCSLDEPGKPSFVEHRSRLPPSQMARASSGRTPAARLTTMQACTSQAGHRGSCSSHAAPAAAGACRRPAHPGGRRDAAMAAGHTFRRQGACTGGSRLWLPGLRLAFQKGHLAAETW